MSAERYTIDLTPCPGCGADWHDAPEVGAGAIELLHRDGCPQLAAEEGLSGAIQTPKVAQDAARRLACGHKVALEVGTRVYNHYDMGFGVLVELDRHPTPLEQDWHRYRSEGATYWPKDSQTLLDPSRIICVPCGERLERTARGRS